MTSMTKVVLAFFFLASLALPSLAQPADSIWDDERLSDATVLLYQPTSESTGKTGSGTLISSDLGLFLLTATHVAKEMTKTAVLVMRLDGDKPRVVDLSRVIGDTTLTWRHHPVADISFIRLAPKDSDVKDRATKKAFPLSQVYFGDDLPNRAAQLTYLGYPAIDLGMQHFSPLVFTRFRSSGLLTQPRADTKKLCSFFCLDGPSMQGCSGSGVFFSVKKAIYVGGGPTQMVGIVHGTISDDTGGKIAMVTPTSYMGDFTSK